MARDEVDLIGSRIGHIRIVELLETGGMGEVYVGVDEVLGRRVAVKAILGKRRLDPESRSLALYEARLLSQLEHPNICRIYDYVRGDESDHLVLELIDGQSLQELARTKLEPARTLAIAEQLADALAVAHAKGIVHRDLKPANVMITPEGRVKVLDFGIAQRAEDSLLADMPAIPLAPEAGEVGSGSQGPSTRTTARPPGSVEGTLAYMSPEQARGEPATAASDMYSFGLILQELASGRPAYEGKPRGRTLLLKVAEGDTAEPAGIDSDLAALIRRLKSVAPEARPAAAEVAERLRWICGKRGRRARRLLLAVAILALALGGLKYTLDLRRERAAAVAARGRAEALVEFMIEDLHDGLGRVGRLDLLEQVAEKALDYYESMPEDEVASDELHRRAQAFRNVGLVLEGQGELDAALAAYHQSLDISQRLVARDPDEPSWLVGLQASHNHMGDIHEVRGELEAALAAFEAAARIGERVLAQDADHHDCAGELVWSYDRIGDVYEAQGRLDAASAALERALRAATQLVERHPDVPSAQRSLSETLDRVGVVAAARGDPASGMAALQKAVAINEGLVHSDPGNVQWQFSLSMSLDRIGQVLHDQGKLAQALEMFERALTIDQGLAALDPANAEWQNNLSWSHARIGFVYRELGQTARARAHWERAQEVVEPVAQGSDDFYLLDTKVKVLLALGRAEEARPIVERLLGGGWSDPQFLAMISDAGMGTGEQ